MNIIPHCPKCASIDIEMETSTIISDHVNKAHCPNCGWDGTAKDTYAAFFNGEKTVWSIERVTSALIEVVVTYAAKPLLQFFELVGMVEADDDEGKGRIIEACVTSLVEASFLAAHDVHLERVQERLAKGEVEEDEMILVRNSLKTDPNRPTPGHRAYLSFIEHAQEEDKKEWSSLSAELQDAWERAAQAATRGSRG